MAHGFVMDNLPSKSQRTYSTTEQWTGEYDDDGRKIYRKVIKGTTAAGSERDKYFDVGVQVENYIMYWAISESDSATAGIAQFIYPSPTGTKSAGGRVIAAFTHTNAYNPDSILLSTGLDKEKNKPVKIYVFYTKATE